MNWEGEDRTACLPLGDGVTLMTFTCLRTVCSPAPAVSHWFSELP